MGRGRTASSTAPNSSNLVRRACSSVCHARPLYELSVVSSMRDREVDLRRNAGVEWGENLPNKELRHDD